MVIDKQRPVAQHGKPTPAGEATATPWAVRRWRKLLRTARKPLRHKASSLVHGLKRVVAPALVHSRCLQLAREDARVASGLSVTLTSHPPRYPTLALTLRSLLNQSVAPDRVVLCVHVDDLPQLPAAVLALRERGLTILPQQCNLRVYLKAIPALRWLPGTTWVTADDDVFYPPDWLAGLQAAHRAEPRAVIARRTHLMRFAADGSPLHYALWQRQTESLAHGDPHFLTGIGGVLYPPGSLHAHALDEARFMSLSPDADDVWLNWMVRLRGTPIRRVGDNKEPVTWLSSQRVGLFRRNSRARGNDDCIAAMVQAYGHACLHGPAGPGHR